MTCPTCGTSNDNTASACSACGAGLGVATAAPVSLPSTPSISSTPATQVAPADIPSLLLHAGTRLAGGQFTVGKVLGQGGFGITYKGGDMRLRRNVAIKEFFPQGSLRHGITVQPTRGLTSDDFARLKLKFLNEARMLAQFNHPGIVHVFAAFEENNTAYMVMEFLEGESLQQIMDERLVLPVAEALRHVRQVGEALGTVHAANLIHRDIKPDNIIVTTDGRSVLIDFGTARTFATGRTIKQTAMLTPGYAPLEQYGQQARFGIYSDVYALGATLYHLITGDVPPQPTDRVAGVELRSPDQVNPNLPHNVSRAVVWALELKAADRPQTIDQFLHALEAPAPAAITGPPQQQPMPFAPPQSSPHHLAPHQPAPRQPAPHAPAPWPSAQSPVAAPAAWMQQTAPGQVVTNAPRHMLLAAIHDSFQYGGVQAINVNGPQGTVVGKVAQAGGQDVVARLIPGAQGTTVTIAMMQRNGAAYGGGPEVHRIVQLLDYYLRGGGASNGSVPPQHPGPYAPSPIPAPVGPAPMGPTRAPVPQPHSYAPAAPLKPPLPSELEGLNWGAAFLFPFWACSHNSWTWLLAFVPGVNLVMPLIALIMGNEWAWDNRKWNSFDEFRQTQKTWEYWGLGVFLTCACLIVLMVVAADS